MATAEAPPSDSSTVPPHSGHRLFTRIRLAVPSDVPHIHKLIHQLAVFERCPHLFVTTESALSAYLFASPPFVSVTVFILEVSPRPFPENSPHSRNPHYTPIVGVVDSEMPVDDPEREIFKSEESEDIVIAGYSMFFPKFPSLIGKPTMYAEDIHFRECYRRKGLGKRLLSAVLEHAVKMDYERVEWVVLDWNSKAIRFQEAMGGQFSDGWRICRLSGDSLQAFAETLTEN